MHWRCCDRLAEQQFAQIMKGALATFLRVNVSLLLASAWTIPAGVAIGFHPRLARIAQPLAQIAASVPATALFPVILLALDADGRRNGYRVDCVDAAGNSVVHPVQRDRRRDGNPIRPA